MQPDQTVIVIGGGQSGLAAAEAVRHHGLHPLILEASDQPAGSWPNYYDSLTLFSPARYSALADQPFPGDPDHYPSRDEVVGYLLRHADRLGVEIRTGTRATAVRVADGRFVVTTSTGDELPGAAVIAATGSFGRPYLPSLPGADTFTGTITHVAAYRGPEPYRGQRVVVVGGGNSAVQVAHELAQLTPTTLATRAPVRFVPQRILGRDLHYWLRISGFDRLPAAWLSAIAGGTLVLDSDGYQQAIDAGQLPRRPMFTRLDGDLVCWPDGPAEPVDAVILATGYRPDLPYLADIGALDPAGLPRHDGGLSTTHPGLGYVGLEFQRSFSSNTLRGVHRDAKHVAAPIAAHAHGAHRLLAS